MTTPRDFVKQDSTLTMRQHCESFLDTLAAKGATDTLSLLEELLETFPVGHATAILILWDWQEKRASPSGEGNTAGLGAAATP
jgi:DNA recombination-dependent growth factor C